MFSSTLLCAASAVQSTSTDTCKRKLVCAGAKYAVLGPASGSHDVDSETSRASERGSERGVEMQSVGLGRHDRGGVGTRVGCDGGRQEQATGTVQYVLARTGSNFAGVCGRRTRRISRK